MANNKKLKSTHNDGKSTRAYAPRIGNAEDDKSYKFVNVFSPLPWQIEPLKYTGPHMLLTGSAGGGKSRTAAEKVVGFCLKYDGATGLIVRKTRTSMYNSVIAFLKKTVIGRLLKTGQVIHNGTERRFEFWNGSMIVYGGMANEDQRENIRSVGGDGGVDIAWMEEAHQFDEADYNEVKGRMRGTAGPFRQIILTTNPDAPTHWIYQNLILGKRARVFYSRAADNYHNPDDYESTQLDSLTGLERDRLRDGKWVMAGGLVFDRFVDDYDNADEDFDSYTVTGNVRVSAEYVRGGGPIVWWVDDGYSGELSENGKSFVANSHPRTFLIAQLRGDGSINVFAESYRVQMLAPAHIKEVVELHRGMRWPRPTRIIYDKSSPSLGKHLQEELAEAWNTAPSDVVYNNVPVDDGNKEVNTFLASDDNDVRRILIHPRCVFLRGECVTYKHNPKTGRVVKDFDHGPDCIRMGVWDYVHGGPAEVDVASMDDVQLPVYDDEFEIVTDKEYQEYSHGNVSVAVLV
jgi:hypothetical protein